MRTFYIYDRHGYFWRVMIEHFITNRGNEAMRFFLYDTHDKGVAEVVRYTTPNGGGYYYCLVGDKYEPINIRYMFPKWDLRNINRHLVGGDFHVVA